MNIKDIHYKMNQSLVKKIDDFEDFENQRQIID